MYLICIVNVEFESKDNGYFYKH